MAKGESVDLECSLTGPLLIVVLAVFARSVVERESSPKSLIAMCLDTEVRIIVYHRFTMKMMIRGKVSTGSRRIRSIPNHPRIILGT